MDKMWKPVIISLLMASFFGLIRGFYYLIVQPKPKAVLSSLILRISLSVALFVLLLIGFANGAIMPHSISGH